MPAQKIPELLAPAGSWDALVAAAAAGADAIYFGGKRFGARMFADNFNEERMAEAVDLCHTHGIRAYITVNTQVHDAELSDVARYLVSLYETGADAVLVQDQGVASLAREVVPDLAVHASTQMTVHNTAGVVWAAKLGMKRVVLAREVSLDEIRNIHSSTKELGIGLEVFVHGALCYSYSGQCLLSSAIGGRSGNRGMCAQPCRKPYVLLRGGSDEYGRAGVLESARLKESYLLSTRDLCTYSRLDEIVRAPVESLKIEGRMKSPEYVAVVTSIYRRALDGIAQGSWSPSREDLMDLALAFNRDFTDGYLLGARSVMGRDMSDKRGVSVGMVTACSRKEATVSLSGSIVPAQGDGLVILAPSEEVGMVVREKPQIRNGLLRLRVPKQVRVGAEVRLTGHAGLAATAKGITRAGRPSRPLDLHVSWDGNTPVIAGYFSGPAGPLSVLVRADFAMEPAVSRPIDAAQIASQLRRTGGTAFAIRRLEMDYPGGLFAPIGEINRLRRDLLAAARAALLSASRPEPVDVTAAEERLALIQRELARPTDIAISPSIKAPELSVYADSLNCVLSAVLGGGCRIYFEPLVGRNTKDRSGAIASALARAQEICGDRAELVWKWPKITKDGFLKMALTILSQSGISRVMAESVGAVEAALEADVSIYGGQGLNLWNHLAARELSDLDRLTVSPELSAGEVAELAERARISGIATAFEIIVEGNLEVIVTEDCLDDLALGGRATFYGLQDYRRIFPFRVDDDGRTHILNSVETCLIDHLPMILAQGLDVAVDARGRPALYASEMTGIYREAIRIATSAEEGLDADLDKLKSRARSISLGGITTGHFLKGLKKAGD